jgi:hypothetical protein
MPNSPTPNPVLSDHPGGGRSLAGVELCKVLRTNAHAYMPQLVHIAADEIERLTKEIDRLRRMMPAHVERILYEGEG